MVYQYLLYIWQFLVDGHEYTVDEYDSHNKQTKQRIIIIIAKERKHQQATLRDANQGQLL